jgi:hypothetical protein
MGASCKAKRSATPPSAQNCFDERSQVQLKVWPGSTLAKAASHIRLISLQFWCAAANTACVNSIKNVHPEANKKI